MFQDKNEIIAEEGPTREQLLDEIATLKKKLGWAHITINDLRQARKIRDKVIEKLKLANRLFR